MIEQHYTAAQLAERLGFSASTIVDWAALSEGDPRRLPSRKIGGRLRFVDSDVLAWLDAQRRGPGARGGVLPTPSALPARGVASQVLPTPNREGGEDAG